MTKAGTVKIAPATNASPTAAAMRMVFCSRMVPRKNGKRNAAIAITAAGKVAETVMPALKPRYAFAAPRMAAITSPRMSALAVISAIEVSAGT
jgi:hypothetical protein